MEPNAPASAPDQRVFMLGRPMPGEMTPRARAYMTIASLRHVLLGLACIFVPQGFRSETYDGVKDLLPLPTETAIAGWGGLFLATGIFCGVAAWLGREGEARWALLSSVVTSALWGGGFFVYIAVTWVDSGLLVNPSGPIIWAAVTAKDITMLRSPLRNPFEELVRRAAAEAGVEVDRR